nr:MAG TPA: hypothetical protein [Bacteriophage sp.]
MLSKSQKNYGKSHLTVKILDCDFKYASSTMDHTDKILFAVPYRHSYRLGIPSTEKNIPSE